MKTLEVDLCRWIVLLALFIKDTRGNNVFCSNNEEVFISGADHANGTIISRLEGRNHYSNNMHCTWRIDAGPAEHARVTLTVNYSQLQWAPVGANCHGYDYITVHNGESTDDPKILTWCGETNPQSITSSGRFLLIDFYANDRNQYDYRGVSLYYEVYVTSLDVGNCAPGWLDDTDLPGGGEYCYIIKTHPDTWTSAQTHCNYDQANLVTLSDHRTDTFITAMVKDSPDVLQTEVLWISLNDLVADGVYHWLDGTQPSFFNWEDPNHEPDAYFNCVVLDKEGFWAEDFCNENDIQSTVNHKFICQSNKVGQTTIHDLPSERTDKGGEKTASPERTAIIIGCLVACGLVVIAIAAGLGVYCHRLKDEQHRRPQRSSDRRSSDRRSSDRRSSDRRQRSDSDSTQPMRVEERPPPTAPMVTSSTVSLPQNAIVMILPSAEPPPTYDQAISENQPPQKIPAS